MSFLVNPLRMSNYVCWACVAGHHFSCTERSCTCCRGNRR